MDMSSMELIPEYCRFIRDSYIILISMLANTIGCHKNTAIYYDN